MGRGGARRVVPFPHLSPGAEKTIRSRHKTSYNNSPSSHSPPSNPSLTPPTPPPPPPRQLLREKQNPSSLLIRSPQTPPKSTRSSWCPHRGSQTGAQTFWISRSRTAGRQRGMSPSRYKFPRLSVGYMREQWKGRTGRRRSQRGAGCREKWRGEGKRKVRGG